MKHDWKYIKLGDIISPAKVVRNGANKKFPVLSITMRDGIVFQSSRFKKSIASVDTSDYKVVYNGQLVIAFPIDEGLIYTQDIVDAGIMSPAYNVWNVDFLEIDRKFLVLYLHCPFSMAYYKSKLRGTTMRRRSMPKEDLLNMPLPVPSFSVQQSIISELDKINELISLKKEQLKDYDNLAQSIFYEMFGDPVVNEKGWEVKKLIETVVLECTISYGIVQPGDGVEDGIPVVRPIDLTGTFVSTNNLKKTTEKISSSYSRTILTGKELLVCVRGTTGVCSLVTDELKGCNVTRGITPLLFNDNTDRWFMYYQFQMPQIKCIIADYTKGITLKQINMADFRKIPVILPPLPLQQLFAQRIELIEKQKAEIQRTISDLETLLASRMQYWFD